MAENWRSYLCNVNDKIASIALNLALAEPSFKNGNPWLLWVWVYLKSPKANGLSDQCELETISAIEDALLHELGSTCHAVEAGRITTDGRREFYFYAAGEKAFKSAVSAAMSRFKKYKFDRGSKNDTDWSQYFNVLYPSPEDMERIKNEAVIEALRDHGDSLESVRDVRHFVYFKTTSDREQYAARAQALGYKIAGQSEATEDNNPFALVIARDQSVLPDIIDAAVIELSRIAEEIGGEYDGWEAEVINTKQ